MRGLGISSWCTQVGRNEWEEGKKIGTSDVGVGHAGTGDETKMYPYARSLSVAEFGLASLGLGNLCPWVGIVILL